MSQRFVDTSFGDFNGRNVAVARVQQNDAQKLLVEKLHYRARDQGTFVIESAVAPRPGATWEHYRCDAIFKGLIRWLRRKGITASNPQHALCKEFGSQVAARHSIYAASRLLRHADIQTTAGHYPAKKQRVTAGLGGLLNPANVVPLNRAEAGAGSESSEIPAD